MSKVINILGQLQDRLTMKFGHPKVEGELSGGPGFLNQYPPNDDEDIDDVSAADVNYTTHRAFALPTGGKRGNKLSFEAKTIKEQEDEESPEKLASKAADTGEEMTGDIEEPSSDIGGEDTAGIGGDVGGMGMDTGMGIPGMEPEEPKTAGQLGRIYELKKIYTRLTAIESYLGNESAQNLTEIRTYVSQAIELFEVISANFDSYKDKLDEIIIIYYQFILEVYNEVRDYFKKETKEAGD